MNCTIRFRKYGNDGEEIFDEGGFRWVTLSFFLEDDFEQLFNTATEQMMDNLTAYNKGGSNWIIDEIRWLDLKIAKNVPFPARSYMPLPRYIALKKTVLNVQNFEDR